MIGSIHLADLAIPRAIKALRTAPRPESRPGLRYATAVFASPLGGRALVAPQPRRVGLIALWDDDAALAAFLAADPLAAALASGWHVRLTPVNAHEYHRARGSDTAGTWPGISDDMTDPTPADGPAVVLTLARTRPSQVGRFLRASLQAARPLAASPGLLWATALARPPVVATCSLWSSAAALEAYAYGGSRSGHGRAMAADRKRAFHQAGVFVRFRPDRSAGQLHGRNPLPADWMTNPLTRLPHRDGHRPMTAHP